MSDQAQREKGPVATAGMGGAGGGTLLLAIAQSMHGGVMKSILFWAASPVSVVLAGVWVWAQKQFGTWVGAAQARLYIWWSLKKLRKKLENPTLTDAQRADILALIQELEFADVDLIRNRIQSLRLTTTA
jgi:hypothetical protein